MVKHNHDYPLQYKKYYDQIDQLDIICELADNYNMEWNVDYIDDTLLKILESIDILHLDQQEAVNNIISCYRRGFKHEYPFIDIAYIEDVFSLIIRYCNIRRDEIYQEIDKISNNFKQKRDGKISLKRINKRILNETKNIERNYDI
jgi:hypothetical protein